MPSLEDVFLLMFLVGFLFTLASAVMSGAFGHAFGEGSAFDAHGAHVGDMGGAHGHVAGGGHAEVGWAQHSLSTFAPLSPTTLSAFVTAAGGMGYVALRWWEWGPVAAGILSLASGLIFAGIVFAMFSLVFRATQGTSLLELDALVGVEADVTLAVPPGGLGEVTYVRGGQRCVMSARCGESAGIAKGSKVVIKSVSATEFVVEETRESWLARSKGKPAPA